MPGNVARIKKRDCSPPKISPAQWAVTLNYSPLHVTLVLKSKSANGQF